MEEIWKDIEGYEGLYQIGSCGNIRSLNYRGTKTIHLLKQTKSKDGYPIINLNKNGNKKSLQVHRLVGQAFIPNPDNLPCINHKDENPLNNCVDNLEWCTYQYNNTYGERINRVRQKSMRYAKPVAAYKDGVEVMRFSSTKEAGRNGFNKWNIISCCNGKLNTHKGYQWSYIEKGCA